MTLSPEARLMSGATLLAVPTILYGGVTLLGVLTEGTAGIVEPCSAGEEGRVRRLSVEP